MSIICSQASTADTEVTSTWQLACRVEDVPDDGGSCVLFEGRQIAVFHFKRRNEWYATDNLCPHKQQMALSRGMIGSQVATSWPAHRPRGLTCRTR